MDFPSNANKGKDPKPPEKEERVIEKVVTGEVIHKKKTFSSKFRDVFLGAELKSATQYITSDVLLPALRNMIVEATSRGIERLIYGDRAPQRSSMQFGQTRVSYNNISNARSGPQQRIYIPGQAQEVHPRRADIAEFVLERKEDAETVVESLSNIVGAFDVVAVSDLYQLVGIPHTYVDNHWGWSSLAHVHIRQTRQGWVIDMPPIEPI